MIGNSERHRVIEGSVTDVQGISVGHWTDTDAVTGCTVVLCEGGATAGVDIRGASPGTRETDLLNPMNVVGEAHAILLSGGSAFGLDAATGVMNYLEARGIGFKVGSATVPIVPAAILFDLGIGQSNVRPTADSGYKACLAASADRVAEGSVGAGTGATVGKLLGMRRCVKGGIGTAGIKLTGGLVVGAIVAVNAIGSVHEPASGRIVAGPTADDGSTMLDSVTIALEGDGAKQEYACGANTTIGVVATNARLDKAQVNRLAGHAHDGLALAVRPAHLLGDGDTLFALATGDRGTFADLDRILVSSSICVSRAIVRAVQQAKSLAAIPSLQDLC